MSESITHRKLISVSEDMDYKYKVNKEDTNLIKKSMDNPYVTFRAKVLYSE